MRSIINIAAAAACVALIAEFGISGSRYLQRRTDDEPANPDIAASDETKAEFSDEIGKSFVIMLGDKELTNKGVPLNYANGMWVDTKTLEEQNRYVCFITDKTFNGYAYKNVRQNDYVKYSIWSDLKCEGENIVTVTYSINKGSFAVIESKNKSSAVKSGTPYESDEGLHDYGIYDENYWTDDVTYQYGGDAKAAYYTEFTLDYESQQSSSFCVDICEETNDAKLYNKLCSSENDPELMAEGFTELMKDVEITCTVHYADGTQSSKVLTVEGAVMKHEKLEYYGNDYDLEAKTAFFVYKLN